MLSTRPASDPNELPCGLVSFDEVGRLLGANARLCHWLGHAPGQLPAELLTDLLAPASRLVCPDGVFAQLERAGRVDEVALTLLTREGAALPAQWNIERHQHAPHGDVVNVAVIVRLPDRPGLDAALIGARDTAEQLPGLVYQYLRRPDGSSSFPYASESMQTLFGITPLQARESAYGVALRIHRDDWPALEAGILESARTLRRWDGCFRVVNGSDVRWLEGRSSPQALPDGGVLWHGYLSDVTERKATEQSQQGRALAEQASRAKSEFLARVSHELRTPLNAVLGFAQLLSADDALRQLPQQQRQLGHIESAGRSLLGLINEVLDLTHIESGRMELRLEALPLLPIVEEGLAMVELMAARAGVALRLQVDPALSVRADRRKLLQCLVNLLTNAIKYNQDGGQVAVAASVSRRPAQDVRIDVRDTGTGFSPSQMNHLFEPFNRLGAEQGNTQGSGLGLVITRGLAEAQGGRLTVDSEPGQGTCFTLHLPVSGEAGVLPVPPGTEPGAIDVLAAAPVEAARRSRRVLYVEDNSVNVMLMQAIFDLRPHLALEVAPTAEAGLAQAVAHPPSLLLLDLGLPDLDGVSLLGRMRQHAVLADVPAVAVSADALAADIDRALAAGFTAYWTKPLDLRQTLAALDTLIAGT